MNLKSKWTKYQHIILVAGAIPATIILGTLFALPQAALVTLVIVLSLTLATMTLWAYANRRATGSEWWQDDHASGWRGY